MKVWRDYQAFLKELGDRFPAERAGIRRFYDECWRVFDALNSLELKSLEEPRYLLTQFARHPLACLTLASFLTTNTGDVARRHIKVGTDRSASDTLPNKQWKSSRANRSSLFSYLLSV